MRGNVLAKLALGLTLTASSSLAASDRADSGHHPSTMNGRAIDSHHDRASPGPHGRDRFDSFDSFHNIIVSPRRFSAGAYRKPFGWHYKLWGLGEVLPPLFITQDYWIDDYRSYDLVRPPFGCVWVRYANDAILVDQRTGEVLRVVRNVFY